jgi:hypothetical protein
MDLEMVGFLVNVPFWSALKFTLNQQVRSSSLQPPTWTRFAEPHDLEVRSSSKTSASTGPNDALTIARSAISILDRSLHWR